MILHTFRLTTFSPLLLVFTLFLVGCVSTPDAPVADASEDGNWRARGKFSFKSPERKQSGNFDWQQSGDQYKVRLFGPLGLGAVSISGDDTAVTIEKGGEVHQSDQPNEMIQQATGLSMPVSALADWLIGQPEHNPNTLVHFDDNGKIELARSQGWRIAYVNDTQAPHLPKRIFAERQGTRLNLVITRWTTSP